MASLPDCATPANFSRRATVAISYQPSSYPGVPLIAFVFPVAALAAADVREALHQLDAHDVLGHLVAELALHTHADRRSVGHRQHGAVHLVGEDGLRVVRILHIDALVVLVGAVLFHGIG